jgi:hypothetical protein
MIDLTPIRQRIQYRINFLSNLSDYSIPGLIEDERPMSEGFKKGVDFRVKWEIVFLKELLKELKEL